MDDQLKQILARRRACESGVFESAPTECTADATESSAHRRLTDGRDGIVEASSKYEPSPPRELQQCRRGTPVDIADWKKLKLVVDTTQGVFENTPRVSCADFKTSRAEECADDVVEKSPFVQRLSEVGVLRPQSQTPRPCEGSLSARRVLDFENSVDQHTQVGMETTSGDFGLWSVTERQPGDVSALKQAMRECSEIDVGVCQNKPRKSEADFQSTSLRYLQKLNKFRSEVLAASQQGLDGQCRRRQEQINEVQDKLKQLAPEARLESEKKSDMQVPKHLDNLSCSPSSCSTHDAGSPAEEISSFSMMEDEEDIDSDDFDDDDFDEISLPSFDAAMDCDHFQDSFDEDPAEAASLCDAVPQSMEAAPETSNGQGVVFLVEATSASFKSGFYSAVLDTLESSLNSIPATYTNFMIVLFGPSIQFFSFNTKSGVPRILHVNGDDFFLPEPLSVFMVDPVPWRDHLQDLIRSLRQLQPPSTAASTEEWDFSAAVDVSAGDADAWNAVLSVAVDAAALAGGGDVISFNASLPNQAQYGAHVLSARMLARGKALQGRFHRNLAKECCNKSIAITPICLKTQTAGLDVSSLQWLSSHTSSYLKSVDFTDTDVDVIRTTLAEQVQDVFARECNRMGDGKS